MSKSAFHPRYFLIQHRWNKGFITEHVPHGEDPAAYLDRQSIINSSVMYKSTDGGINWTVYKKKGKGKINDIIANQEKYLPKATSSNSWKCEKCTYENKAEYERCEMCEKENPAKAIKQDSKPNASTRGWDCKLCTFQNRPNALVCSVCNQPRPGKAKWVCSTCGGVNTSSSNVCTKCQNIPSKRPLTGAGMPSAEETMIAHALEWSLKSSQQDNQNQEGATLRRQGTIHVPTSVDPIDIPTPDILGLSNGLTIESRPVTNHGLTGMQTSSGAGPKRRVADHSYYVGELQKGIDMVENEILALQKEFQRKEAENKAYSKTQSNHRAMSKEVDDLKSQLKNFNIAIDHARSNIGVEDIEGNRIALKTKNDAKRDKVDSIYLDGEKIKSQTKEVDNIIARIRKEARARIACLGEEDLIEYTTLDQRRYELALAISKRETTIQEQQHKINELQSKMESKEYTIHQKGLSLLKQKKNIFSQIEEVKEETDTQLSSSQIKTRLMKKIKVYKIQNEEKSKIQKQLIQEIEELQSLLRAKDADMVERRQHAAYQAKYNKLFERDAKMKVFIANCAQILKKEEENKQNIKETILIILHHISKGLKLQQEIPDSTDFAGIKQQLSFKQTKMQTAEETKMYLQNDLTNRKQNLAQLNTLEPRMRQEMKNLRKEMSSMKDEIKSFKDEETLQHDANDIKREKLKEKQKNRKRREHVRIQLAQQKRDFDKKKREFTNNIAITAQFEMLQQELLQKNRATYQIGQYINEKKCECEYRDKQLEVINLIATLNNIMKQQC